MKQFTKKGEKPFFETEPLGVAGSKLLISRTGHQLQQSAHLKYDNPIYRGQDISKRTARDHHGETKLI